MPKIVHLAMELSPLPSSCALDAGGAATGTGDGTGTAAWATGVGAAATEEVSEAASGVGAVSAGFGTALFGCKSIIILIYLRVLSINI